MFTFAISFSLIPLLLLLCLSSLAGADTLYQICDATGNYTANSTYQSNLKLLLSTLPSNGSASGFLKLTVGQIPNQVYGLVLCRGDLRTTDYWFDPCLLRYSNQQFLSSTDNSDQIGMYNTQNITQPDRFSELLGLLLNSTADRAVNSTMKFASGELSKFTSGFPKIYSLMQCTPDMSRSECRQCLEPLINPLPSYMVGKEGGKVIGVRCSMRYEVYSFYEGRSTLKLVVPMENATKPAPAPASPPHTSPAGGEEVLGSRRKKNVKGRVLETAIPAVTVILLTSIIYICYWRMRKPKRNSPYETELNQITSVESLQYDQSTLRLATANFSEENKLGAGGFGVVYKGLLPGGREIAVKRLRNSGQGLGELKNELVLVAKLQHRNLVRLLGVCLDKEKMIVYEYVPNKSLDIILFDPVRNEQLQWGTRYKIINGIARGLLYLHEESRLKIIHRDLKASNILLDADLNPKIADFGLAKLFDGDQSHGSTNRVVGTFGYMAPEYVMYGKFSIKSDVFSFGILVLEILTGRKNSGSCTSENAAGLLSDTWEKWRGGTAMEIVDPALGGHYQGSDLLICIQIGLLCVQENPADRPNMSTVMVMLNSKTVSPSSFTTSILCGREWQGLSFQFKLRKR